MHRNRSREKRSHLSNTANSQSARRATRSVFVYDYCDESEEILYQVIRREPGRGGSAKSFSHRHRTDDGGWSPRLDGVRFVPYRLPQLLRSPIDEWVFLPEGEKNVNALCELGITATCNVGGAGMWRDEYNPYFRDRRVVVLPDNDGSGLRHAEYVARSISPFANRVKILDLPMLPANGDVCDWLEIGGGKSELLRMSRQAPRFISPAYMGLS